MRGRHRAAGLLPLRWGLLRRRRAQLLSWVLRALQARLMRGRVGAWLRLESLLSGASSGGCERGQPCLWCRRGAQAEATWLLALLIPVCAVLYAGFCVLVRR